MYRDSDHDREWIEAPPEKVEKYRTDWRIDYARLVHCPAFRRLQGKTQLFPGESDFFRNRLTHSIEVAQIAKSIAIKLNYEQLEPLLRDLPARNDRVDYIICEDIVEFAGLAHDLGHPPFGHNGEIALDECMLAYGGFEGNAQTLRILSRVEKKRTAGEVGVEFESGRDMRRGLNLTYRSLASVLKYDSKIPVRDEDAPVMKGYYSSEHELVTAIKKGVLGRTIPDEYRKDRKFKTVECQIMDIADDIAYSTYDFEDAMKADFSSLLDLLRIPQKRDLLRRVAFKVWKNSQKEPVKFDEKSVPPRLEDEIKAEENRVRAFLFVFCAGLLPTDAQLAQVVPTLEQLNTALRDLGMAPVEDGADMLNKLGGLAFGFDSAEGLRENGYRRATLTSSLVHQYIQAIEFDYNREFPALSRVWIDDKKRRQIEILKHYTYEAHVEAARMQTMEYRGREIVKSIFDHLVGDKKHRLLPDDWRLRAQGMTDEAHRRRCISDFIAGMTDRYAVEFYDRLTSGSTSTIFKDV